MSFCGLLSERRRTLPHSPFLLLLLAALALLLLHIPLAGTAIALGLLSHRLLDLADNKGLPRRSRNAVLLSTAALAIGLIRDTPYVLHRSRLIAVVLLFLARALFLAKNSASSLSRLRKRSAFESQCSANSSSSRRICGR